MSLSNGDNNIKIVKNIKDSEGVMPICCPTCEKTKMVKEKHGRSSSLNFLVRE